ncbi:MAG: hypothetical protein NTX23_05390 [Candidatus Bipolaricaulota bacterium]|nr:hypothetical protein [Candidatus Bipolaricaulota bacterium]
MKRLALFVAVFAGLALSSVSLFAADLPVVRQPNDPVFSAADRSALSDAWTAIEKLLRPDYSLTRVVQLSGRQWADTDYAQFVAGALQSAGYTTLLATGMWAGATRTWVLAGVPVSLGLAYLPVEAAPSLLTSSSAIGQIAWQGGASGTSFDARYLSFSQAVALSPNAPPAVILSLGGGDAVVDVTTTFQVLGTDPGAIFFCYWEFGDGTRIADARLTLWHTFRETGDVTVNVAVFGVRGARTDLSLVVEVLAEKPDCGCGH